MKGSKSAEEFILSNSTWHVLSLTRKREFAEYIRSAKRAENKAARLGKIISIIQRGEGLNDKYKKVKPIHRKR